MPGKERSRQSPACMWLEVRFWDVRVEYDLLISACKSANCIESMGPEIRRWSDVLNYFFKASIQFMTNATGAFCD